MEAKIRRIGNSLGIILPKDILELINLREGDDVEVKTRAKKISLILSKK